MFLISNQSVKQHIIDPLRIEFLNGKIKEIDYKIAVYAATFFVSFSLLAVTGVSFVGTGLAVASGAAVFYMLAYFFKAAMIKKEAHQANLDLLKACRSGDLKAVQEYEQRYSIPKNQTAILFNPHVDWGVYQTDPLHEAVKAYSVDVLEYLISKWDLSINTKYRDRCNIFHILAYTPYHLNKNEREERYLKILRLLANWQPSHIKAMLEEKDWKQETPRYIAQQSNNTDRFILRLETMYGDNKQALIEACTDNLSYVKAYLEMRGLNPFHPTEDFHHSNDNFYSLACDEKIDSQNALWCELFKAIDNDDLETVKSKIQLIGIESVLFTEVRWHDTLRSIPEDLALSKGKTKVASYLCHERERWEMSQGLIHKNSNATPNEVRQAARNMFESQKLHILGHIERILNDGILDNPAEYLHHWVKKNQDIFFTMVDDDLRKFFIEFFDYTKIE